MEQALPGRQSTPRWTAGLPGIFEGSPLNRVLVGTHTPNLPSFLSQGLLVSHIFLASLPIFPMAPALVKVLQLKPMSTSALGRTQISLRGAKGGQTMPAERWDL